MKNGNEHSRIYILKTAAKNINKNKLYMIYTNGYKKWVIKLCTHMTLATQSLCPVELCILSKRKERKIKNNVS